MSWKGGAYVWRTRKPHAVLGLPVIGRHVGYVGETNSFKHREVQHLRGGGTYNSVPKAWADLEPKVWRIPLPNAKWLRLLIEAALIYLLCPVYNVKGQPPYNLRRISPKRAEKQRKARDTYGATSRVLSTLVRWALYVLIGVLIYQFYVRNGS